MVEFEDNGRIKRSLHAAGEYSEMLDSSSFYNVASRKNVRNSLDVNEFSKYRVLKESRRLLLLGRDAIIRAHIKSGSWIKFRDLSYTSSAQQSVHTVVGTITDSTSVIPLHQFCRDVTYVMKKFLNRCRREVSRFRSSTMCRSSNSRHDLLAICISTPLPKRFNVK